ncbi:hypothetical protein BXY66_2061 [Shimia isoporae]|uniref:DUF1178 family protein n=1 Tax=Shimia isoporae TaxID=647720 RepID=A0A4R1NT64_9RHOB|nr:DUF1178 family protein [Shimia isoporae]TCL09993.1 hypothetical protein BXY66_2061 [Shimia isoporae]
MISYTLKCANDHRFDSWFQSADAFDKLKAAGMVTCAVCGDKHIQKAMMAPRVRPARDAAAQPSSQEPVAPPPTQLSEPANEAEAALAKLRKQVEENSDYVGKDFASQARAMHEGSAPERAIYGEAKLDEAKALIEDGVPVAPLPFNIGRKTN